MLRLCGLERGVCRRRRPVVGVRPVPRDFSSRSPPPRSSLLVAKSPSDEGSRFSLLSYYCGWLVVVVGGGWRVSFALQARAVCSPRCCASRRRRGRRIRGSDGGPPLSCCSTLCTERSTYTSSSSLRQEDEGRAEGRAEEREDDAEARPVARGSGGLSRPGPLRGGLVARGEPRQDDCKPLTSHVCWGCRCLGSLTSQGRVPGAILGESDAGKIKHTHTHTRARSHTRSLSGRCRAGALALWHLIDVAGASFDLPRLQHRDEARRAHGAGEARSITLLRACVCVSCARPPPAPPPCETS